MFCSLHFFDPIHVYHKTTLFTKYMIITATIWGVPFSFSFQLFTPLNTNLNVRHCNILHMFHSIPVSSVDCNSFLCRYCPLSSFYTFGRQYHHMDSLWRLKQVTDYFYWDFWTKESIWAATWQNKQSDCAPSEDSDQPGHPPSLIRVFAVRMKKAWVLSYPLSAQRRLWSDWADAQASAQRRLWSDWADTQADLSLRWAHSHFVGFVISRLICSWYLDRSLHLGCGHTTFLVQLFYNHAVFHQKLTFNPITLIWKSVFLRNAPLF